MLRIKALREAAGKTQKELAAEVGIETEGGISLWESGKRKPPSDKLPALAAALNCTINDLFEEKGEKE